MSFNSRAENPALFAIAHCLKPFSLMIAPTFIAVVGIIKSPPKFLMKVNLTPIFLVSSILYSKTLEMSRDFSNFIEVNIHNVFISFMCISNKYIEVREK